MSKNKKLKKKVKRQAPVIESLEPRILLSADLPGLDVPDLDPDDPLNADVNQILARAYEAFEAAASNGAGDSNDPAREAYVVEPADEPDAVLPSIEALSNVRHELIIVDPSVPDYEILLARANAVGGEGSRLNVVMIDPQRNGVEQITQLLLMHSDLDAIHLISHGSDGEIRLGKGGIDLEALQLNEDLIRSWSDALTDDGDILIYGCEVADTSAGRAFVEALAGMTGADVAASDDLTGHQSRGGDWSLEHETGEIETAVVVDRDVQESWSGVLADEQLQAEYFAAPLGFEENLGQTDELVDFMARGSGYTVFLSEGDAVLAIGNGESQHVIRLNLVGASGEALAIGQDQLASQSNYLIGSDQSQWRTEVDNFGSVYYGDVYDGVDLRYYGNQRQLEYDFIVDPGSDPNNIRLNFDGVHDIQIAENGELRLILNEAGDETRFKAPVSYQSADDGSRIEVTSSYVIHADGTVGFTLGDYDTGRELVIDPILDYGTYLGGTGTDTINAIKVDSSGNVYVTGTTASTDFPNTTGPFGTTGGNDVFVTKLSADGSSAVYTTYLGGGGNDQGNDLAIDASGNVYVVGKTASSDFPKTAGAFDETLSGASDGFVLKLDATGSSVVYGSYLGSNLSNDTAYGVAVDGSGRAHVTGTATGSAFTATTGAYQTAFGGGRDAYLAIFSADGSSLDYATYLGGSGGEDGLDIALDASGNAYITGMTNGTDMPVTGSAYQGSSGGGIDTFFAKLSPLGGGASDLVYGTYLGGTNAEEGTSIAVDASGRAYIVGTTVSADFDTTVGAYDTSFSGTDDDGFFAVIDPGLSGAGSLVYSTKVGDSATDDARGVSIDSSGVAWIAGTTLSAGFPTTGDAHDATKGGTRDAFITAIDPSGGGAADLVYSTFLGGSGNDYGFDIALDASDNIYVAGETQSADFDATAGAYDEALAGSSDGFVAKFNANTSPSITFMISSTPSVSEDLTETATFTVTLQGDALVGGNTASVDIAASGSALSGTDYENFVSAIATAAGATAGVTFDGVDTLTFDSAFNGGAGLGAFSFAVDAIDDTGVEGTETIVATLSNPSIISGNATFGTFSDSFTEAGDTAITSHTPDSGLVWTEVYDDSTAATDATISAATDAVSGGSNENFVGQAYAAGPAPTSVDQTISFSLPVIETDSGTKPVGVFSRWVDSDNFYYLQILPNGNAQDSIQLSKMEGGVRAVLGSFDATIAASDTFRLEITDAAKKIYHNGIEVVSSTDNALTAIGTWGMYFGEINGSVGGGHLRSTWAVDDFVAQDGSVAVVASTNITETDVNNPPADLHVSATTQGGATLNSDGGNDVYFVADDGAGLLGGLTTLTVEASFSVDTPAADNTVLLSYADGANDEELALFLKNNGSIWLHVHSNGSTGQLTTNQYPELFDGEIHHVGVSWDSTDGAVVFYIDGQQVESFAGYQTGQSITGTGELVLGQDQDSVLGGFNTIDVFSGTLYDVRIFNDVRTAGEISAGFGQTLPNTEPGMIANWTFDDLSTGGVVTDTVSGNNLTLQHVGAGGGFITSTSELSLEVQENATNGTVIGTVTAVDPNTGDTFNFSLLDDAGGRFAIASGTGVVTVADGSLLDYESATSHNITVQVEDGAANTYSEVMSVSVTATNEAPVAADDAYSVDEDGSLFVDWWDTDWAYRQHLAFGNLAQTENLTNFTVLVKLNSGNIDYAKTKDDGSDLRFFDPDGTALAYEIDTWNESGDSFVWVEVPQIDGVSNTDHIVMYYGNAAATDGQASASVWDNGYASVWHMDNDPTLGAGAIDDSVASPLDGTAINMDVGNLVAGKVGSALSFDGIDEAIRVDSGAADKLAISGNQLTIEAWVKRDGATGGWMVVVNRQLGTDNSDAYVTAAKFDSPSTYILNTDGGYVQSSAGAVPDATWQYLTAVQDGTDLLLYSNGALVGSAVGAGPIVTDDNDVIIGGAENDVTSTITEFFKGLIDEVRISDVARSADWVAAQYASMNDTFVTFGGEEAAPAVGGVLANDSDVDDVNLTAVLVSGLSNAASFTLNADGSFSYAPTADFNGTDSFTYKVNDGTADSNVATVTITVNPINDAPVARPDGVHLSFDGDDFVEVADHPSLQMTNKVTMEAWINPDGTGTGSKVIVNKEGEYELGITAETGEIKFAIAKSDNTWAWHNTGYFVTAGEWTHVAVTYDGVAGEAKTYINGELVDTYSQPGPIGDVYAGLNDLWIGGRQNDPLDRFHGQIDDVRVWSTTRTLGEIQANKDGQLGGAEVGLVGNWRLDEAAGGAVIDQSAFGNDGVLGGSEGAAAIPTYQGYVTDQNTVLNIAAGAGVLANDTDVDSGGLTVTNLDTTGMLGILVLNTADGSFSYDPSGAFDYLDVGEQATETFTYTANDGSVDSNTVTATITITGVNDAPTTSGIADVTVTEDAADTIVDLYAAFADVEDLDPALTYSITSNTNAALFTSTNIAGGNLTLDYAPDANGTADITVRATDTGGLWVESTFTVTVNPQNDTPTTSGIADVTVTEDDPNSVIDLYAAFADVEDLDPALTYTITNNTNAALFTSTNIAGGNLTLDYAPDANGTADITVRATDTGGLWVESTFTVTVNPQNDTPTTSGIADVTVTEDDPNSVIDLYAAFADVEDLDPALTYTITNNTNAGLFTSTNIAGGNLTLDYAPDANGTADITVRATDTGGLWVESTFTVTVNPQNDTPTTSGIADVTVTEDDPNSVIDLYAAFADVEDLDPALTYTITNNTNAGLFTSTNIAGGNLTLDYAPDANGTADITVRATDTGGLWVESTFTVTVNPQNDTPTTSGIADVTVTEDDPNTVVDLYAAFADAEDLDPALTYTITNNTNAGLFTSTNIAGGNLTLDYAPDANGTADITVRATDTGGLWVESTFTVTVNPQNDTPTTSGIADVTVTEDDPNSVIDLYAAFADVEDLDPALTYTITNNTNAALFTSTNIAGGNLTLDYAPDANGTADITVRATDTGGLWVESTFTFTVNPQNDTPTTSGIANVTVTEDDPNTIVDLYAAFADVEDLDPALTYTITNNTNAGLFTSTNIAGGNLTLDYAPDANGTADITVRATDTGGLWVESTFTVTVNPQNDTPTTSGIADVTVTEDDPNSVIDLYAAFADVEDLDPALTYTITNNTNAALFTSTNIAGGNLTLDYAPDANGTADITVRATDTGGLWVESTFTFTVNPQNDTPTTSGIANVTVTEDDPNTIVDLYAAFADVEDLDPALTYTITNNTNAGLFTSTNIAGGNLTLDYAPDANGTADITVRATDTGGLWVESTFTVTVNPQNDTPTTSGIADVTVTEDDPNSVIDLYAAFADVEDLDPALTYTITNNTNAGLFTSTNIAGGNLTLDYAPDANGTADITVRATDTGGLWVESTFTVTVNPVNDAPVIGGVSTGAVTEDIDPDSDTLLEASGALTISDPDTGESSFVAGTVSGSHGNLIIDASGNWDYEADNTQAAIQQLDAGESVNDILTVTTADGTNHNVTVTINGGEDASVIGGVMAGTVVEDGVLVANGTLSITDVDTSDNPVSFPDEASTPGDNGYGDFQLTAGSWSYTLNNGHAAVQALGAGDSLTDTHTFTASDGSTQLVSIVVAGAPALAPPPVVEPPVPEPAPDPVDRPVPPPATEDAVDPPVEEEPDLEEPPPTGGTDPTASEPEAGDPSGIGLNPPLPEPLVPDEVFLSVINDARSNDAPGVQKTATPVVKPSAETAQTFLQELKSFWQAESTTARTELSDVRLSQDFWDGLDKMANDLDESVEEQDKKMQLSAEAAAGVGVSLTAGFVSWALRAGSMAASFLAAMPTWRHFDPMPVLAADDKKQQGSAAGDAEDRASDVSEEGELDDLFDR